MLPQKLNGFVINQTEVVVERGGYQVEVLSDSCELFKVREVRPDGKLAAVRGSGQAEGGGDFVLLYDPPQGIAQGNLYVVTSTVSAHA